MSASTPSDASQGDADAENTMASSHEKLAESLAALKAVQDAGKTLFQSRDFSRVHRQRLVANGFLQEVIKGWYMLSNPAERTGDSTRWYAAFFSFVAQYCNQRFGSEWHLSPEASIALYAGNATIPKQVLVYAASGTNNALQLQHGTSLFDYKTAQMPARADIVLTTEGLRLLSLPAALMRATPTLFMERPLDMQVVINQIADVADLLERLLDGGHTVIASRLAGALRAVGRPEDADRLLKTMHVAGHAVTETNPFETQPTPVAVKLEEPCSSRIRMMWAQMRPIVIDALPPPPGLPADVPAYLADVEDRHIQDAYHSLSIEGYQVTESLIASIASGHWSPSGNARDQQDRNALAARGYFLAFKEVQACVEKILAGQEPGQLVKNAHHDWYAALFGPSVTAGILESRHLAGYRAWPVYIRNSRHVPPAATVVRHAMPTLFDLISNEPHAGVRAVLGHFIFVYIHPYGDGNGRIGRFLMNAMLASGGYPWTVIRLEDRATYMDALEHASVSNDITPFARFVGQCVKDQMHRKP